jgi:ABC-2 type transport system ATP-binding protein
MGAGRDADRLAAALREAGGAVVGAADGTLLITGVDAPTVGTTALASGVALHELVTERPDLEAVFLELTRAEAGIR